MISIGLKFHAILVKSGFFISGAFIKQFMRKDKMKIYVVN